MKLAVIMDSLSDIHYEKDTSLAMLVEAQHRGWSLDVITPHDLYCADGMVLALAKSVTVAFNASNWFQVVSEQRVNCHDYDLILMRQDPPFDTHYIYNTLLLELVEASGVMVINKPQSLRDFNEKLATCWFPECCTPTLVTSRHDLLVEFLATHEDCVLKPLHGMGGQSIFRVSKGESNVNVIIETLTEQGSQTIIAQRFIPEISQGDKRILMIAGEPVDVALARIPGRGDFRGNLAAGATGQVVPLSERDRWICQQIGPTLKAKGLWFVGLDVIGDYITEINVTSPTCVREIDAAVGSNICGQLFDVIEKQL